MFVDQRPQLVSLANLGWLLEKWHGEKFGSKIDVVATHLKVGEEMGELAEAVRRFLKKEPEEVRTGHALQAAEEAADIVIVLYHLVRGLGLDLSAEILRKLQVIYDRLDGLPEPPARVVGAESALSPTWYDIEKSP